MSCEHKNFESNVVVSRITSEEAPETVKHFMADVKVRCLDCGQPFEFVGIETIGVVFDKPTTSIDNTELRIPIKPSEWWGKPENYTDPHKN